MPVISRNSMELGHPQRTIWQPSLILKVKLCYRTLGKNKQREKKYQSKNSFTIQEEPIVETPCVKSCVENGF